MDATPLRCCRIHAAGDGSRPEPWRKGPRRLPFHLLVASRDGAEEVVIDGVSMHVPSGGCYLVPAGVTAVIGAPTGNRPVFVHCDIVWDGHGRERAAWMWHQDPQGRRMPVVQPSPTSIFGGAIGPRPPPAIDRLIDRRLPQIVAQWRQGDALAAAEAENALEALFLAWARATSRRSDGDDAGRVARAEAAALQQLDGGFGVADFAAAAGLARSRFHDVYAALRGEAPGDFLRRARIDIAGALLAQGASVGEAAAAGGFADRTSFSRAFAAVMGMPPGLWRDRRGSGRRAGGAVGGRQAAPMRKRTGPA